MKTMITIATALAFTGSAAADDMAKKDAKPKAPEKKEEPKKAEMPKPPAELDAMMKMGGGTWKCTGKGAFDMANPTAMTDLKGGFTAKADMNKWFIKVDWNVAAPMKMNGLLYITYDAAGKKWHRVMVDSMGSIAKEWSNGPKDGKVVWEGEGTGMGMTHKSRSTEEWKDKEVKMTMEMSMDGKKWMTGMEQTCKK